MNKDDIYSIDIMAYNKTEAQIAKKIYDELMDKLDKSGLIYYTEENLDKLKLLKEE